MNKTAGEAAVDIMANTSTWYKNKRREDDLCGNYATDCCGLSHRGEKSCARAMPIGFAIAPYINSRCDQRAIRTDCDDHGCRCPAPEVKPLL